MASKSETKHCAVRLVVLRTWTWTQGGRGIGASRGSSQQGCSSDDEDEVTSSVLDPVMAPSSPSPACAHAASRSAGDRHSTPSPPFFGVRLRLCEEALQSNGPPVHRGRALRVELPIHN